MDSPQGGPDEEDMVKEPSDQMLPGLRDLFEHVALDEHRTRTFDELADW